MKWFAFFGAVAGVVGCNLVMDLSRFNEAPETNDGGDADVPDTAAADTSPEEDAYVDPRFACLGNPKETPDQGNVSLELLLADATKASQTPGQVDGGADLTYVTYTPRVGVKISACSGFDPTCANPVAGPEISDDAGAVRMTFPGTFVGFYHGTRDDLVPFSLFTAQWPSGEKSAQYGTSVLSKSDEQALNFALNNAVDLDAGSQLGELFVIIFDCNDRHVEGATIEISQKAPNTLPFYVTASGVPDTTAQVTDKAGVGGAVNVPAGPVRATAKLAATNTFLGQIDVYVFSGELTYAWIRPRVH